MKVLCIIDESLQKELGYLFYYEKTDEWYIELLEGIDEWDFPLILEHFVRQGKYTLSPYWSRVWVEQRIVPSDRQNLGSILKENHLKEYDVMRLLITGDGRCAQDECMVKCVSVEQIPVDIMKRRTHMLAGICRRSSGDYLCTFQDGSVGVISDDIFDERSKKNRMEIYERKLSDYRITCGGSGISFGQNLDVAYEELYASADTLPLTHEDIRKYAISNIVTTTEVMSLLHCTRQNVNDLAKKGRLKPLPIPGKSLLFYRPEVMQTLFC